MRFIKIVGACLVVAAAAGALASFADALGRARFGPLEASPFPASLLDKELAVLTNQGISPARAWQSIDVQGKVAQADLVGKLQASAGGAFAGVWFEPAAAQLQIGATSPTSRRTSEGVVAQAGLSADVAITPVRSTMDELLATQKRWNRKLASLFAQEAVKTGLEPQRNAVSVTLGSSVPAQQRDALKREASAANVNVLVTVVASARVGIALTAKTECKKWVREEAYCSPSITSGVTIAGPTKECKKVGVVLTGPAFFLSKEECEKRTKPGKEGEWARINAICTAGPLTIPTDNRKERAVLTAGHCIEKMGEEFSGINKKREESVIGPVRGFVNGGGAGEQFGDYGEILIEPAWQTGKPANPVFAVTTEWKKMNEGAEETSYPVKGERLAVVNNTDCHEGQTSGESCGEIKMLNVTYTEGGRYYEGLVEDVGENLIGEGGDSGGPWLFIETNREAVMEGTLTAIGYSCLQVKGVVKGKQFFKTQTECISVEFLEKEGNEGSWERSAYKCAKVVENTGAQFYKSQVECETNEKAGKGTWERTPATHLFWMPLKRPIKEAPEGSLEALKLELLTKANENRTKELEEEEKPLLLPEPTEKSPISGTGKGAKIVLETKGGTKVECGKGEDTFSATKFKAGSVDILFTECKSGLVKCTGSEDKTAGSILVKGTFDVWYGFLTAKEVLHTALVILPKEAKITCGEIISVTLKGCLAGLFKPTNEKAKVLTAEFIQTKGANDIGKVLTDKNEKLSCSLEVSVNKGAFEGAGVQLTEELSGFKQGGKEATVEVMA
jgi:hypothetical protein